MTNTIAIVSGKGGVGKTTTAANLALSLQEFGENVVAIDCDQAASNLALHLDVHPMPEQTLQKALDGEENVLESISLHESGLMVMPSTHAIKEERLEKDKLQNIIDNIDVDGSVLIDAPPGLTENVHTILDVADEILLVTNPEIPAVTDAVKVMEAIKQKQGHKDNVKPVLTKHDETRKEVDDSEAEMALEVPIFSKIPYDKDLKDSIFMQTPVVHYSPYSKSAIGYRRLAAKLTENYYEPPKLAPLKRWKHKLKRKIG